MDKLCNARAKVGREDSLLKGVKVLIPDFESVKNEVVSHEVIEELVTLKETAYSYGLKDYQIPNDLNTIYNNRTMVERDKPTKCWSSLISPPLYGTNLMSCVLWDRITDLNYHYGIMHMNCFDTHKALNLKI